jgi:hypothetical protein
MVDYSSAIGGDMIEPELFGFVVDGEVINWSVKGCFGVGKVPVEELGAGVSDKSGLVISTS